MTTTADTCPYDLCDGSGFVVDEGSRVAAPCRCRARRIERRRARSLSAVIPRKYGGASFDRPPVSDMPAPQVQVLGLRQPQGAPVVEALRHARPPPARR